MNAHRSPFHAGEREAQRRVGVEDVAAWAGGFIRGAMPEQHRRFFAALPFLVVVGGDGDGWPWATVLEGGDGFVRSPDPRRLAVAAVPPPQDPLAGRLVPGAAVGLLGIELATRRRNRMNGVIGASADGLSIEVRQSFGNCPQYIHAREWRRAAPSAPRPVRLSRHLDAGQRDRIRAADTLFIGSGQRAGADEPSAGYDASHRGGPRGFVRVSDDGTRLRIPDYAGNNFFNTIGNLITDPRVGLLFVDFGSGGLLHVAGRARIDWSPADDDPQARRFIEVAVEKVIDRPAALALRWGAGEAERRILRVVDKVRESALVTSFHLAPADGAPLAPFAAGQHLPVELAIPGRSAPVARSYSLSGAPDAGLYRISVKREPGGLVSGFLHDATKVGDTLAAHPPAGDFVVPADGAPLVLVSAGAGITPMVAILHDETARASARPILFAHVARDGANHAFRREVDALAARNGSIRRRVFYTRPRAVDIAGADYDGEGRVRARDIAALAPEGAHYMLCGPGPFVAEMRTGLERCGVPPARIQIETFGEVGTVDPAG